MNTDEPKSADENWQRKVVFERGRVEMKCDHGQLARTCLLCEMRDENLELKAKLADLEAQLTASRNRAQNHAETLRGIRAMPDSDGERMKLWAADGLSGYTEPVESTLLQQSDKIAELEARCAKMRRASTEYAAAVFSYLNAPTTEAGERLDIAHEQLSEALAEGGEHGEDIG